MKPTFSEEEVERVAGRLGMARQQFIETYLERAEADSETPWQTRATPCPFLKGNLAASARIVQPNAAGILKRTAAE